MLDVQIERYTRSARTLLEGIDLKFAGGGFSVILGPNGAGKSTLLKLISGQVMPDIGRVVLGDHSITEIDLSVRARQMAMLTQEHPLNFPFPVLDVVRMGCHPLGLSDEDATARAHELLHLMELPEVC